MNSDLNTGDLTARLNERSINSVQAQIARKISDQPYLANNKSILNSVTDMDHHPYTRFFRGVYYHPEPVIFEREAGYRAIHNSCYSTVMPFTPDKDPEHCYQPACSTVFPCYNAEPDTENEINTSKFCIVGRR